MTSLALEIGDSTIAAAQVEPDGKLGTVQRVPVPDNNVWDTCRAQIQAAAVGADITDVGVASVGPVDMAAGIAAPSTIPEWATGFEISEHVREVFPNCVVRMAESGVCATLAEQRYGQIGATMDALVVHIGTRIAGGFVIGGFIGVGHTGNAGNIGHIISAGHDDPCGCGGRGCTEAVASEAAMLRWARDKGWEGTTIAELYSAAQASDDAAIEALRRSGFAVGQAITSAASLLDVDLVVIGGSCIDAGPAWWRPLHQAVATHARLTFLSGLRVIPSILGADGALAGAGVLSLPTPQPAAESA